MKFVDVDAGASGTGVNHEGILNKRDVGGIRNSAVDSFEEVWVCLWRGRNYVGYSGR
jgi:hypothetical protein